MTVDELKRAHDLTKQIEKALRLITVYREVNEVIVGTKTAPRNGPEQLDDQITLMAADIREQIVAVLKQRLTTMREELQKIGVA